jgi:hypothetical protein
MVEMPFADDLRAFLKSLDAAQAEFIVVGGYAVAFHGFPRNTGDLDIWIRASADNASRVERAVREFGFPVDASARAASGAARRDPAHGLSPDAHRTSDAGLGARLRFLPLQGMRDRGGRRPGARDRAR